jgi:hypothetical protein
MSRKLLKAVAAGTTVVTSTLLATSSAFAQYYYSSSTDDSGVGACLGGLSCLCWIPFALLGLVSLVFTVMMIIDVNKRDVSVLPNKNLYMILMLVGLVTGGWSLFVALYYYFARKKKLDAMGK